MSSEVERFRLLSSDKLEQIVAPHLDTAVQLIMHELECFDRRTNERIREHVPDVADLRYVASDQGGPLFPQGVVEHVPPGSLLNPIQRRPEHGACVAAPAPIASTIGGSETDVNSVFAAAASARSRNEANVQFMSSLPQKSTLCGQYMRTLEEVKRGSVPERRSDRSECSVSSSCCSWHVHEAQRSEPRSFTPAR